MKLFMIFTFTLCVLYIQAIHGIVINDIDVPLIVTIDEDDSNDNIELDCDYDLGGDDPSHLVVKWYLNNKLIYQWIFGQEPWVLPSLQDVIETKPTSADVNHKYRALTLVNPSTSMNGTYKCSVHTNNDSKSKEKPLNIVDISNYTILFNDHKVQNETHLECTVSNIFPKPYIHFESEDPMVAILTKNNQTNIFLDNAYYNATRTAVAQNADSPENFACYVSFEGLPLNISANVVKSGNEAGHSSHPLLLIVLFCCSLLMSKKML